MQNSRTMTFNTSESWTILSDIEQSIKRKIEIVGVPLKDWGVSINYGIKTGLNDAFIITGEKKDELIAADSNSAEIIRPILRGRDIKRYGYEFADLWLISTFPSRKYNIDDYPAVRDYLLSFGINRLEQTGKKYIVDEMEIKARKKTNNKWFETQDSINYWDDFSKQKIVYREISDAMNACMVEEDVMINNKCYMVTGDHLPYLISFFNSRLFTKIILQEANITGGKGEGFLQNIRSPIPIPDMEDKLLEFLNQRSLCTASAAKEIDVTIDLMICSLFQLSDDETLYVMS